MIKYLEYIPDYFQNLINFSSGPYQPILQISWKSTHNFELYVKKFNKQTNRNGGEYIPLLKVVKVTNSWL